jgi:hypothetical protein
MGVGNPGLDHRKMVWSPVIGQGLSSVGKDNMSGREVIYSTSMFNNILDAI